MVAQGEFDSIVQSAAANTWKVESATSSGFHVDARIRTNSGKGSWDASYDFDPESGDYSYSALYRDSGMARAFGDAVRDGIRNAG